LYNWSSSESQREISRQLLHLPSTKDYLVYEYWSDTLLGTLSSNSFDIVLAPTSSKILSLHEKLNRPMVLSTSRHITQGAIDLVSEEWNGKTLSCLSNHLIAGEIYSTAIYIPDEMKLKNVFTSVRHEVVDVSPSMKKLLFHPTGDKLSWKITFE
jgi:hypothetical protein